MCSYLVLYDFLLNPDCVGILLYGTIVSLIISLNIDETTSDADGLGEYTGVKPDEYLTIDKERMERQGLLVNNYGTLSSMKSNACSTMGSDRPRPEVDTTPHVGSVDYDTGRCNTLASSSLSLTLLAVWEINYY